MGRRKWREYQKLVLSHEEDYSMEAKDWEPTDKCSLCVDQGDGETQHVPLPQRASSAGSASSVSADDSTDPFPAVSASAMTTLESVASSMAASLAAVAALSHGKPPAGLYPPPGLFPWYLPSEPPKPSPPVPEQPLDLSKSSSKSPEPAAAPQVDAPPSHQHLVPSPSLKVPAALNRLYKAKPRLSAVAGRRTYTEDELQAALRDIQSGKLGTRRAAVIYGIPRSTLRNKVYKLAMERERDAHLVMPEARVLLADKDDDDLPEDDEDKDSGAEEEREVEKALMRPIISIDDFMRLSSESGGYPGTDSLRTLLQHGSKYMPDKKDDGSPSPPVFPVFPSPGGTDWTGMDHAALGPYINRLLGGNPLTPPNPFAMAGSRNSPTERSPTESPGDFVSKFSHLDLVRRMMLEERMLQEEQHRKERQFLNGSRLGEPGPSSSVAQDDETSSSSTPPNVILRIPSFKPTPKNGMPGETPLYPLGVKTGESSQLSLSSPPISTGRSESSSPPSLGKRISVSLTDVIAKSISQKFQQPTDLHHLPHTPPGLEHFSVRRSDFSQPLGCSPPIMRNHNNNHVEERKVSVPTSKPSSGNSTGSTGGKGTRPKRGKYRNYDRDSLVEAVRAVQRGEMSVHRAGSYYGVPHSTLEYKVKERHLMRPRKREPKSVQEEIKLKEDPIASRIPPPVDKCKLLPPTKPPKTPFTPPSSLPAGPNGLKMPPMFDPSIPYSAAGHPFPFWHPGTFPHLPMEYRNPNFPPTPDHFFASQMIQRLQEDSSRTPHSPPPTLGKTARELAETLYDGSGANGSFLDGIIRSSLESSGLPVRGKEGELKRPGPENMSNKALLDQLCRNSKMAPVPKAEASSSDDENSKRAINQNRPCDEAVPVSERVEVTQEVPEEAEQNPPTDPEEKAEPEEEAKPEYSNLKTDNVDESACDSNHTIKRVKLEEET